MESKRKAMRTEGNISKVAICPKCDKTILACHVDYLNEINEKEFTEFTNEGFIVKVETKDETISRGFGDYELCSTNRCKNIKRMFILRSRDSLRTDS